MLPVKKIVIVGGGTAGWLTAAVIAAKHRGRMVNGFNVTVVESPTTPTIGVGEGTWPTLRCTLARIGVSETEFFRQCDASFKQGALFARWTTGAPADGREWRRQVHNPRADGLKRMAVGNGPKFRRRS